MKKLMTVLAVFLAYNLAWANQNVSQTLMNEWNQLNDHIENISKDGSIGGYMDYKSYGDVTLLWRTGEMSTYGDEVIRLYKENNQGRSFVVSYYKSHNIIEGKVVLRRFIGPEPSGWIHHTIDYNNGDYLQRQGRTPYLSTSEKQMLNTWGITLLTE